MTTTTPAPVVDPSGPVARSAAAPIAIVVSIGLIALALIAGRDFLIERDVLAGPSWTRGAFGWLSRVTWQGWMLPVAIGAIVLGIALVVAVVKPRARAHFSTTGTPRMWLGPTDVARRSTAVTMQLDGVLRAHTTVDRRTAKVMFTNDAAASHAAESVRHAVAAALSELAEPPRVQVVVQQDRAV